MLQIIRKNLIFLCFILVSNNYFGQVSTYPFTSSSGTYSAIAGGTVLWNGASASMDDVVSAAITIPSFSFNCTAYTSIYVSTNGFITFGSAPATNNYTPISNAAGYSGAISAFGNDLNKSAVLLTVPEIRYQNVAASNEFVIQWTDMCRKGKSERISFQIRLNYSTNDINIVYGGTIAAGATTPSLQVGLRGASGDFNDRTTTTNWAATTAGGASTSVCTFSNSPVVPASGQAFNWALSSCTVVQASTATIYTCDYNQPIISLQVQAANCTMSLTQIIMTMAGTNPTVDVSNIHIYYTGTTNTFSNTNEFVVGGTAPAGGNITINGSQALASGTNYFWIAYDMNSAATVGDNVDALLVAANSVTIGGVTRSPAANNPAGTRTIAACPSYPGTSAGNLKFWVKSDAGVTGAAVTSWADQSGAGVTGNLISKMSTKRPTYTANAINYQPYIVFNGTSDFMRSTNKFVGTNIFNVTDNTILMVKQYNTGGGVDFKWESDSSSGPYRMGLELNATNAQRFDFANDGGITPPASGLTSGATNILNKDIIMAAQSNSTTSTIYMNGNFDGSLTYAISSPLLTFAPGTAKEALYIGGNDTIVWNIPAAVRLGEIMIFNKQLSTSELSLAQSYLAIKYGITLGNNQGSGSAVPYLASDGTQIWNQTGYHNYVIGIGRDNASGNSGLNKLKSTSTSSLNGSTDILTITNGTTPWNGAAFGTDKSFLVIGNDAGSTSATNTSMGDLPSGIQARIARTWKAQETGTVGTVTLKFNMAGVLGVGGVAGANDLSQVRLLVDADNVYATGTSTQVSPTNYDNTTDTVTFQIDFTGSTGYYFTIGSVNYSTAPLPIELLTFTAEACDDNVCLNWATASETNNDYFTIEKTKDAVSYDFVAKVAGAGNSSSRRDYSALDKAPYEGTSYYRLKQTDYNGNFTYSGLREVDFTDINFSFNIYPNPNSGDNISLKINASKGEEILVVVCDVTGRETYSKVIITDQKGENIFALDPSGKLAAGIYMITATSDERVHSKKLIVR